MEETSYSYASSIYKAERFAALYKAASNVGKLQLLNVLLHTLDRDIGGVNVTTVQLGKPQSEQSRAFEEVARYVEEFVSRLDGVERAYAVARLYPRLARRYVSLGEFDKAVKLAEEALKALDELWRAYERDRALTEETLRPYLELTWVKPDLEKELNDLSHYVYHNVAHVYLNADELDKAIECAERACEFAKKLGDVYDEVVSCGLPPRLTAIRDGAPPVEKIEEMWQKMSRDAGQLDAETIITALGRYMLALVSVSRLSEVEKVLEKWGWALKLHPSTSSLTYGVLSLFDGRHLEKVVGYLSEEVSANLSKFAEVLHGAIETGLFANEPAKGETTRERLLNKYGEDMIRAVEKVVSSSVDLFLSALVGLAYCIRGVEWGLKLARATARAGSQRFKGIGGRLFGELYKALEGATMGNCVTDEVLKAVYKLYYRHV